LRAGGGKKDHIIGIIVSTGSPRELRAG